MKLFRIQHQKQLRLKVEQKEKHIVKTSIFVFFEKDATRTTSLDKTILKSFIQLWLKELQLKYKQMMSSIQQYDDIQKIQSFIITISSKPKTIKPTLYPSKQIRPSLNILEDLQKSQRNHPVNVKFYQSSTHNNKASIADLALRKIQYRTRLHENVQRCAQMKEKCELLINHSPHKAKNWSSGCLKKRNSNHKSQVKMLNYYKTNGNPTLNIKTSEKNIIISQKQQIKLPQLTVNPFFINVVINSISQRFCLFKTLKEKENYRIYLAQSQTNKTIYTLKIIKKVNISSKEIQNLVKQLKIQSFANHLNLIKVIHVTSDKYFLYIFYEAVTMPSLSQQIKENGLFEQRQVRRILKQICLAVQYLQRNNIFHQNICPQSIYYQQGMVKLGQFYKSDYINALRLSSKSKSQGSLKQKSLNFINVDSKVDIWDIGILAYELLFGCPPIQLHQNLKYNKKAKQTLYFCQQIDVSNTAKQFIISCLQKNSEKRLGIKEIIEHGFLKGGEKYRWTTL